MLPKDGYTRHGLRYLLDPSDPVHKEEPDGEEGASERALGARVVGISSIDAVADTYPFHPEPKRLGPDGVPCHTQSEGRLQRRTVCGAGTICIGKESHRLEDCGLVFDLDELINTYPDCRRDPWTIEVLPRLPAIAIEPGGRALLMEESRLSKRAMRELSAERSRPRDQAKRVLLKPIP
jgi:hypothetical protein